MEDRRKRHEGLRVGKKRMNGVVGKEGREGERA